MNAKRRALRLIYVILVGVAIGVVALISVFLARGFILDGVGRPLRYEIPAGHRGWVTIRYEERVCPPLLTRGIYLIIPVGADGHGCTASPLPRGWRYRYYDYVQPDGNRTSIPRGRWGTGGEIWAETSGETVQSFFVGTEEELKRSWGSMPR